MLLSPDQASYHPLSLQEILFSRDARQARQTDWLARHQIPLISFTIVAPGPFKDSRLTRIIFNQGIEALRILTDKSGWEISQQMTLAPCSGPEALIAIGAPAQELKVAVINLEEQHPLGRLWDIDILTPEGGVISRRHFSLSPRRCLVCGKFAIECARLRTHSYHDLHIKIEALLHDANLPFQAWPPHDF